MQSGKPDKKTNTASQTLSEVFAGEETRVLDAEKLNDNRREKSCFVRSLETMSAKDIAEPAEGRKKKRLTAAFVTRLAAFLVCFGVFGISLYMIVERVIDDIQTNRLIEDLQTAAVERAVPRMNLTQQLTPGYTLLEAMNADSAEPPVDEFISVDYDMEHKRLLAAIEMNEDVYGWIRIKGTVIDYPILQGPDNDYYLNRTITREYSKAGSIFADFRLSDTHRDNYNAIFYGHCMSSGTMFRAIMEWYEAYATRDSVADTMEIEIITRDGVYIYEVFSAYRSEGTHFITASFADKAEYLTFLKDIRNKSILRRRPAYDENSKICTLVTCTNVIDMPEERYVLHGILKQVIYYG